MPKRRDVTIEELAKIMKLRETSTPWSQIARDTGVPRQIAKRAFMERELKVSREELNAARQTVAAEDLRWHRDCLIKVAESLVTILDIPSFSDVRTADDILLDLWKTDILRERQGILAYPTKREIDRTRYRNEMLFDSLQNHTHGKIDWRVLDNWKAAWNKCKEDRDKLKKEAQKTLLNKLEEKPELKENILKGSKGTHKIEQMGDGIVYVLWQGILIGKLDDLIHEQYKLEEKTVETDKEREIPKMLKDEIASTIQPVSNRNGVTDIQFGESSPMPVLILAQADRVKEIVETCTEVCDALCRQDNVKSFCSEFKIMKKSINYLEGRLDPIFLRPMILNSPKCELCPA